MTSFLIFVFAIFYLLLSLKRLDWALALLVLGLPSYLLRFNIGSFPSTVLELMILIAFGAWLYGIVRRHGFKLGQYWRHRLLRQPYPFRYAIALILVISFVSVAIAGFSLRSLGLWRAYFFEPIMVFILFINAFKRQKGLEKVFVAAVLSLLAVSVLAIFQYSTGKLIANPFWADAESRRAVSFFGYPNAVGLYIAPLFFLVLGLAIKRFKYRATFPQFIYSISLWLVLALSLLAVYTAKSEGALLAMVFGLWLYGLLYNRRSRIWSLSIASAVLVALFVFRPFSAYVLEKAQLHDLSGQIRKQQWSETIVMLKDNHWFWGSGLSNYQEAVAPYHQAGIDVYDYRRQTTFWQPVEIYLYPHNLFLNFWTELGVLGMIAFIWLIAKYLFLAGNSFNYQRRNNKRNQAIVLGLAVSMVAIVVQGLVDVPYFKNDLAVMFWILTALVSLFSLYRHRRYE